MSGQEGGSVVFKTALYAAQDTIALANVLAI
jgi:hypothetical protein